MDSSVKLIWEGKEYKPFKVKVARGLILKFLQRNGYLGWTSIWNTIYVLPECLNDEQLIRHEQQHAIQIQRDGYLWQPIKYMYYTWKYGYRNNPYEVEARKAALSFIVERINK